VAEEVVAAASVVEAVAAADLAQYQAALGAQLLCENHL